MSGGGDKEDAIISDMARVPAPTGQGGGRDYVEVRRAGLAVYSFTDHHHSETGSLFLPWISGKERAGKLGIGRVSPARLQICRRKETLRF